MDLCLIKYIGKAAENLEYKWKYKRDKKKCIKFNKVE